MHSHSLRRADAAIDTHTAHGDAKAPVVIAGEERQVVAALRHPFDVCGVHGGDLLHLIKILLFVLV